MVTFLVESSSGSDSESDAKLSEIGSTDESTTCTPNENRLAQKETRAVLRLRLLVFLALVVAAVVVSLVVYFISGNSQDAEFKAQYRGSADKILGSFESVISQKIEAIGSLGVTFTAFAHSQNATFPFVTINELQERSESARQLSSALMVFVAFVVSDDNREKYEKYSLEEQGWIEEGRKFQNENGIGAFFSRRSLSDTLASEVNRDLQMNEANSDEQERPPLVFNPVNTSNRIFEYNSQMKPVVAPRRDIYMPMWQSSPVLPAAQGNLNMLKLGIGPTIKACLNNGKVTIGGFDTSEPGDSKSPNRKTSVFAAMLSIAAGKELAYEGVPFSTVAYPIFSSNRGSDRQVVGAIMATINWASYFENVLPPNSRGVILVLEHGCETGDWPGESNSGVFSYEISGETVKPLGFGDHHDEKFNYLARSASFHDLTSNLNLATDLNQDFCPYKLTVYPSQETYDDNHSNLPVQITCTIAMIFLFTVFMFVLYDRLVERRQNIVMKEAEQTSAIVSSLFPDTIRDRLIEGDNMRLGGFLSPNHRLKSFLNGDDEEEDDDIALLAIQKPIADMFPHTTVLFSDISGFTSWSSTRDPSQVFVLLQTVYQAFDNIAKRRRVFKVETIGDSYVAVTGIPNAQSQHATIMARFAWDCMIKMQKLTKKLEDTGDLAMRFGLHSGPVTAGVLRGEKSRFQLFGDTVNTAARMESTGRKDMIQASHATAELLVAAGKGHWLTKREDSVLAKGKGILNTFWIAPKLSGGSSTGDVSEQSGCSGRRLSFCSEAGSMSSMCKKKHDRLVEWVVEILAGHVKKVIAKRGSQPSSETFVASSQPESNSFLDEVAEVIVLPKFDPKAALKQAHHDEVEISFEIAAQLREYVATIAGTYRDNSFHNFEHACHVTMSVDKFLKRIVAPDLDLEQLAKTKEAQGALASHLHDYTHGINSDPMTLLAIVFSALIHDVDHKGVSNTQLCKEDKKMADKFKNKSVAEQHSLEISWELLMSDKFRELRECMFADQSELLRFRQVLVNVVLATDIFDKELNDLRKNRWNKAFGLDETNLESSLDHSNDLRATIVIEHIIQASDVSHCMVRCVQECSTSTNTHLQSQQHWHVYRKWNERLFKEMYLAFQAGRMGANPATFWYEGELKFFDHYIIPLAKKLKNCGVFGVSSDECLTYALQNRAEWEERGEQVVSEMIEDLAASCQDAPGEPTSDGGKIEI